MSQQELLKRVIEGLGEAGIPYMVTGSVASSLQGEPRATHDIDIVVAMREPDIPALLAVFPSSAFYWNEDSIRGAIRRHGQFNVIDTSTGDKVDFWILTDDGFDRSRFSRKVVETPTGFSVEVSSPEDTILAKLRWADLSGGSEKQFTDALRIYEVQHGQLDIDYLEEWAGKLGIELLWEKLLNEAETDAGPT